MSHTIRVLYRQPDTMALWGIPYALRPGQSPRDLWEGRKIPDTIAAARGWYGRTISSPGPRADWVWLGQPGWYGTLSPEMIEATKLFLESLRGLAQIPEDPAEWVDLGFHAYPLDTQRVHC